MKTIRTTILLCLFAGALILPNRVEAQMLIGPFIGYNFDAEGLTIGATLDKPLGLAIGDQNLNLQADAEYILIDNATWIIIDGGLSYPFPTEGSLQPYAGAGLVISFFSFDSPDFGDFNFDFTEAASKGAGPSKIAASSTDIGILLHGGAQLDNGGSIVPFANFRFILKDGSTAEIVAGAKFKLGG